MIWKQITLVGVGLLGGSIGLRCRAIGSAKRVVGLVRREASVRDCRSLGVVDEVTMDMAAAAAQAHLVILGTPILQMRALARKLAPLLPKKAIVTDVGSVKGRLVSDLERIFGKRGIVFIGSHPMAGSERMGPRAARADLFEKALCVITPTRKSPPAAVRQLTAFWTSLGAQTLCLSPSEHDALTARSSHLPHVLASVLATQVLDPRHGKIQSRLCASGFRDTTRVASGSPEMWRDIALENRRNLLRSLKALNGDLERFAVILREADGDKLLEFFQTAKQRRDAWLASPVSASPE